MVAHNSKSDLPLEFCDFFQLTKFVGDETLLRRITSTWGEMFGSSALHTQTTALGEGIKSCTVGRGTIVTITTRDWQVKLKTSTSKD